MFIIITVSFVNNRKYVKKKRELKQNPFLCVLRLLLLGWGFRFPGYINAFSGFSVGCCINREKVICYQLEFGK